MSLISLILFLVVVGVVLYLVELLLPMDGKIKQVVRVLVGLFLLLYILQCFGLISGNWIRLK